MRIVWKHLPLAMHKDAPQAHAASVAAARQGKFWEFHDKLFANQRNLKIEALRNYAQEIGLDVSQFEKDLNDPATQKVIDADKSEARTLGVTGTPGFFVRRHIIGVVFDFADAFIPPEVVILLIARNDPIQQPHGRI